jgi:acetolactate synthase-1/2/3 large subunit
MGFALPAAVGAKIGAPERPVVCVVGDGGFQMTCQELGTIAQEQLPVKILVLNNNFLGMVRQWQELFFEKRYSFVDLHNPDFVKLASAFDIPGKKISVREELDGALLTMLEAKGPYLLEVVCEKEQNVFPMVPAGASVTDIRLE